MNSPQHTVLMHSSTTRRLLRLIPRALTISTLVVSAACGASGGDGDGDGNEDGNGTPDSGFVPPPRDGGGTTQNAVVYGHSGTTLFKLNPDDLSVTKIGDFSGCEFSVIDIALDKSSKMYGTTSSGLYTIDTDTALCTLISSGSYPNSLSFVPEGTFGPTNTTESLVAFEGSDYIRIDTQTGSIENIGTIAGGLTSSGDIVSVIDGGTYLTVDGPDCNDCIVQIDPATGGLVRNWGQLADFNAVYGLAYWGGTAYGFNADGRAFAIDFTGSTATTTEIPVPGKTVQFFGAGSTTAAPAID